MDGFEQDPFAEPFNNASTPDPFGSAFSSPNTTVRSFNWNNYLYYYVIPNVAICLQLQGGGGGGAGGFTSDPFSVFDDSNAVVKQDPFDPFGDGKRNDTKATTTTSVSHYRNNKFFQEYSYYFVYLLVLFLLGDKRSIWRWSICKSSCTTSTRKS